MGNIDRRKSWLLGAGALGAALTLFVLAPREQTSVASTPVAPKSSETPLSPSQPAPVVRVATAPEEQQAPVGIRQRYIVQASSAELARGAVMRAGGVITGDLSIIRAVGAELDDRELAALWSEPVAGLRVYDDASVTSSATAALPETYYPTQVGASPLHTGGITGRGVTVAVLDTGVWQVKGPLQVSSSGRNPRVLAQYDVILARENPSAYPLLSLNKYSRD